MSFYEFHTIGGMPFMAPLTLILTINVAIIIFVAYRHVMKKSVHPNWLEAIRQIGGLALAFGVMSTIWGLFFAFGALEESKEVIPFNAIMGGLKVGLITALYGLWIFLPSLLAYIILKSLNKDASE